MTSQQRKSEMDSSTKQMYTWASNHFGIDFDEITNIWLDSYTRDAGGCETCGPEYETTHTIYIYTTGKTYSKEFIDVFSMISELCAEQ